MTDRAGTKSRKSSVLGIKACLDQLADEAGEAHLLELSQLIRVAALAAEDVIELEAKAQRRARRSGPVISKSVASAQTS